MQGDNEIITQLPPGFVSEFADEILGTIPEEKVQVELRQVRNARIMQSVGSCQIEGLGQKMAEIDSRLFFRMQQDFGKDTPVHEWLPSLLADNPSLCAPGYRPKANGLRHGKTFVGGKPV